MDADDCRSHQRGTSIVMDIDDFPTATGPSGHLTRAVEITLDPPPVQQR